MKSMSFMDQKNMTIGAVIGVFLVLGIITFSKDPLSGFPVITHAYERIDILDDDSNKGYYDPSVEYDANGQTGYMVYSALEQPDPRASLENMQYVHTHLAMTQDQGRTWRFVTRINESLPGTVTSPDFAEAHHLDKLGIDGMWHNEVATLVYDPDDKGKEWKLFWHKYFSANPSDQPNRPRILSHSWIMFKEADSPAHLANADERRLFSTDTAVKSAAYNFQDYLTPTSDVSTFSEPAAFYHDQTLYVALSYFEFPFRHDLLLLASDDHGATWRFVNVPLRQKDARRFDRDYSGFWGVSMAREGERTFLLAPPVHKKRGYQGTFLFEFENIAEGRLKRDENGHLKVIKYLKRSLPGKLNSGQSTYHAANINGGIVFPQVNMDTAPAVAQIYNTHEKIISLEP